MAPRAEKKYRIMNVTADIGIIVEAPSIEALYQNAASALFDVMCDGVDINAEMEVEVSAAGDDAPSTMVNWLNELLYIFETSFLLLSDFTIRSADAVQVKASARGEKFDPSRHRVTRHIKAVTYHRLIVAQTNKGWRAEVLFDI